METVVTLTLIVKGDRPLAENAAVAHIGDALIEWFTTAAALVPGEGYPGGTLLHYSWNAHTVAGPRVMAEQQARSE